MLTPCNTNGKNYTVDIKYDMARLAGSILEHIQDGFKEMNESFDLKGRRGGFSYDKYAEEVKKQIEESLDSAEKLAASSKLKNSELEAFLNFRKYLDFVLAIRYRLIDSMMSITTLLKILDNMEGSVDSLYQVKTGYFKDNLIDLILLSLQLSIRKRMLVIMPDDASAVSYIVELESVLNSYSTSKEEFRSLLQIITEYVPEPKLSESSKIVFISYRTFIRLFKMQNTLFTYYDVVLFGWFNIKDLLPQAVLNLCLGFYKEECQGKLIKIIVHTNSQVSESALKDFTTINFPIPRHKMTEDERLESIRPNKLSDVSKVVVDNLKRLIANKRVNQSPQLNILYYIEDDTNFENLISELKKKSKSENLNSTKEQKPFST